MNGEKPSQLELARPLLSLRHNFSLRLSRLVIGVTMNSNYLGIGRSGAGGGDKKYARNQTKATPSTKCKFSKLKKRAAS